MEEYDLPAGLYVSAVSEGSDCAAKGIVTGDVLLAANGVELTVNEVSPVLSPRSASATRLRSPCGTRARHGTLP